VAQSRQRGAASPYLSSPSPSFPGGTARSGPADGPQTRRPSPLGSICPSEFEVKPPACKRSLSSVEEEKSADF